MSGTSDPFEPIAIVGMACVFPGSPDLDSFWQNIRNKVDCTSEVPEGRWSSEFYDPDSSAVDRFYCRRGGFVDDYVDFDPLAYGIMPKAAESAEPDQLLSLRVGVEALRDAGYLDDGRAFNREKTGVIVGRGNYLSAGTLRLEQHVRVVQQTLNTLRELLPDLPAEQLDEVKAQIKKQLPPYGPDSAIGLIPNLAASRLANRLDLRGPAYTVDAACASALLAVEQSCQLLHNGDCDVMVAGGLHFVHDLTFWATFCQLGALSRKGVIRPFSADADGILAGEGIGLMVLKRLRDAERDGDRIYATVAGVGSSSDGRSASLMAPGAPGQLLALERAWRSAALQPDAVGLVEAHGTGTPAGDLTELETLRNFFGGHDGKTPRAGLGSVKSMIGHAMPAAGAAGMIKAALSVYHGEMPATINAEHPHPAVEKTRFRLLQQREPWKAPAAERVAAVNAFGFGGINAHVVMRGVDAPAAPVQAPVQLPQVLRISAPTQNELQAKLLTKDYSFSARDDWRIAIVNPTEKKLTLADKVIAKGNNWQGRSDIFFSRDRLLQGEGKIAFLFPGVDSAFDPQVADLCAHFKQPLPRYCEKLDPLTDLLAVGIGLTGLNRLLRETLVKVGIKPDAVAGHSIGEWSAMTASGLLSQQLCDEIAEKMDPDSLQVPEVVFLALAAGIEKVAPLIADLDNVHISHDNCPHQMILCTVEENVPTLLERFKEATVLAQRLPIVSGFHSPLLADYARPFTEFFKSVELNAIETPLWSATTAAPFADNEHAQRQLTVDHLVKTVRFRELVKNMYAQGFRAFVQVGFGSLTGFVGDTLKGQPHLSIAANSEKRSGLDQLAHVAAALWVEGHEPDFARFTTQQKTSSEKKPSGKPIKLQLGVPLLHFDHPLSLPQTERTVVKEVIKEVAPDKSQSSGQLPAGNDPLQRLFADTLSDIQRAGDDILSLWEHHKNKRQQPGAQAGTANAAAPAQGFQQTVTMHLDVSDNIPFIMDHSFYPQRENWPDVADRHPVIPLTMELNLMRRAVEQFTPGLKVIRLENVRAFNWLIVTQPVDIEIRLNCRALPTVEVEIAGYAAATAVVAEHFPDTAEKINRPFENMRPAAVTAEQLYQDHWMFHGPAYQSVTRLGPIADNGIKGRLTASAGDGALLDNMGQLAGYFVMEESVNSLAMPIGVEKVCFYAPDPKVGDTLDCQVWIRHIDEHSVVSDQQLTDQNGTVVVHMLGWQTRRFEMDREFWLNTKSAEKRIASERYQDIVVFRDRYNTAITRDYLGKRYLNRLETEAYEQVSPRDKRHWLNARVALKDAARDYLWSRKLHVPGEKFPLYPKELHVYTDDNGEPQVRAHISDTFTRACPDGLQFALAQLGSYTAAIAAETTVGIGIAATEARDDNFINWDAYKDEGTVLSAAQDETLALLWAARNALTQLLQKQAAQAPETFTVDAIDGDRLCIDGYWLRAARYRDVFICWTE